VVELGPGDVLSALMKRIDRSVKRLAVGDPAGVAALKESLQA
jgi:malonyl CoA-acyl carrier protein transacylase